MGSLEVVTCRSEKKGLFNLEPDPWPVTIVVSPVFVRKGKGREPAHPGAQFDAARQADDGKNKDWIESWEVSTYQYQYHVA